jgi:hypothetical protein
MANSSYAPPPLDTKHENSGRARLLMTIRST